MKNFLFCIVLLSTSLHDAMAAKPRFQNKSDIVFYTYPIQYFQNAWKVGVDFHVKDRYVLHGFTRMSYGTKLTSMFISSFDQLGSMVRDRYANESSAGLILRNRVGEFGIHNNTYYMLAMAEYGTIAESYSTQFAPTLPVEVNYNKFNFRRFGVGFGRQWSLFGQMVMDANFYIGVFDTDGTHERIYRPFAIFGQQEDEVFIQGNLGLGIGNQRLNPKSERKKFLYALAIDAGAVAWNGMEFNAIGNATKRGTWVAGLGYGINKGIGLNVTDAESFRWRNVSVEYRLYARENIERRGVYLGLGSSVAHMVADIIEPDRLWREQLKTHIYDAVSFSWSVGFTEYIHDQLFINGFIRHKMIYGIGDDSRAQPHPDYATGLRTELGLKIGIANFTTYENRK